MPEKPGHAIFAAGRVFWVLRHVMEVGKRRGIHLSGAGSSQISVNNARISARALELAVERTGMQFWAG